MSSFKYLYKNVIPKLYTSYGQIVVLVKHTSSLLFKPIKNYCIITPTILSSFLLLQTYLGLMQDHVI